MAEVGQHADTPEMILQHPEGLCLALRCAEMPEARGEWSPNRVKWAPSLVKWSWSGKPGVLRETLPQTGGSALLLRAEVGLVWIPRTTIDHATRLWAQSPGPATFHGEVRGLSTETCGVRPDKEACWAAVHEDGCRAGHDWTRTPVCSERDHLWKRPP